MARRLSSLAPSRADLIALLPALLLGAGLLLQVSAFVTDDAAITLRYAIHFAEGHGLRWNPQVAHPVEGYTNFLHVLLGAACWKLGLPALQTLRVLNQLGAFVACAFSYALARRALASRLWAGVAALLLSAHAPLWYWASSGLETGLYLAATYGALFAFLHARPGALWPAVLFALAALARFEGPVVFAACVFAALLAALGARSWSPLSAHARWMLVFALAYGAYFAFRLRYFGHLLPNSAYYKRGELEMGLLSEFAQQCWPLLVLALAAPFRALGRLALALLALLAAHALGFLGVAPSVAYFHRFFLPVVPALAILAAAALQRVWSLRGSALGARVLAGGLLAAALAGDMLHSRSGVVAVDHAVDALDSRIVARAQVAAFVARHFGAHATLALEDVGVVGYVLPNPVLDLLGLNDEAYVHMVAKQRGYHALSMLLAKPEVIALVSKQADRFVPQYGAGALITRISVFTRGYTHVRTCSATLDRYHYFVFARNDQQEPPSPRAYAFDPRAAVGPGTRSGRSIAAAVDQLARQVREQR